MKKQIMQKINNKDIEMKSCYFFWAKKLCLQSLLAFFVVLSALLLNIAFYFIKKTDTLKSLSSGWSGMENFLLVLPYEYIFLFFITMLLANLAIHRLDLSHGIKMNSAMALLFLLIVTFLLSLFFSLNGIEDAIYFWTKNGISLN